MIDEEVLMQVQSLFVSAGRGAHGQLSGFFEIQDGEIHDSVDEITTEENK